MHVLQVKTTTRTSLSFQSAKEYFLPSVAWSLSQVGALSPMFSFLLNLPAGAAEVAKTRSEAAKTKRVKYVMREPLGEPRPQGRWGTVGAGEPRPQGRRVQVSPAIPTALA